MKYLFSKIFKLIGIVMILSVTLAFSQCYLPLILINLQPLRPAMKPTPQTESFVRAYQENLGSRTAANGETPLMVEYRIGSASDPDVCTMGQKYGPYIVAGNSVEGDQTVSADKPTLQLVNTGDLTMCTIITAPINATLSASFDNVYMDNDECTEDAADISGIWQGAYSCESQPADMCEIDEGMVTLNILQDEHGASYSDGEAEYNGPVCGNHFEYSGGTDFYDESGTFVLNNDGSASKTSHYQDIYGSCSGDCEDPNLVRISQQALFDQFDDDALDEAWILTTENTTDDIEGWTYSESSTTLMATAVTPEIIHMDTGQTWSQLKLYQQLPVSLSDFIVEFDISWTSDDETAMQNLRVELYPEMGERFVSAGYSDTSVGSHGLQETQVWGSYLSSQPTLPSSGTATIRISRSGENTSIHWDGVVIHDGYSIDQLNKIYLIFAHYPIDNGEMVSSFGSLSMDRIRVLGVVAE